MYLCLLVWKHRGLDALHHPYPYTKYFSIRKQKSSQNSWEEEKQTYELTTVAEAKGSNSACSS
jgi:hypothetical protein